MYLRSLKYVLVYVIPLIVLLSLFSENYWSYSAVIFVFLVVPFIELFNCGTSKNLSEAEEKIAINDKTYDWLLYGLVPLQFTILLYFLYQISDQSLPIYYKIGATAAYGMACGIIGINTAHELGHRKNRYEQIMSKMLLLTSLYMHFIIEHNRGHHKNVATDKDPASARPGENVYAFFIRSITGSWLSAWHLESKRLKHQSLPFWSLKNEMIAFQVVQLLLLTIIAIAYGIKTMLFFLCGAFIGILMLETVNYIEHYGLRREKTEKGYERTKPVHSWNSNHPLGRLFLLELTRHSDHHYMASRKYQLLRHYDESPQLPAGYPAMMLLSLIPPLWFAVMNKKLKKINLNPEPD